MRCKVFCADKNIFTKKVMKKGKEKTGQLVARYGLLVALGLGGTSFVSAAAPAPAWKIEGKSVMQMNPGEKEGTGDKEGYVVEYKLVDKAPTTTEQSSPQLTSQTIRNWFMKTDTSDTATGLVNKAVEKFVAGNKVEDLQKILKGAEELAKNDQDVKAKIDALAQKKDLKDSTKEITDLFSDLKEKGDDALKALASDGLFAYLSQEDYLKQPVTGGNVAFELIKENDKLVPHAHAVFDAPNKGSVANFAADGVPTMQFMGKDTQVIAHQFELKDIKNFDNYRVTDPVIVKTEKALADVRSNGVNGNVGKAVAAMEKDIRRAAAVMYIHEIVGADGIDRPGAIARVKEAILKAQKVGSEPVYHLGKTGDNDLKDADKWGDTLTVNVEDADAVFGVFKSILDAAADRVKDPAKNTSGHFKDYTQVEELLSAIADNANVKNDLAELASAGLAGGDLPDISGSEHLAETIKDKITSPKGTLETDHVQRLAELILAQVEDIPTTAVAFDEPAKPGDPREPKDHRVYIDSEDDSSFASIYELLNENNGGLLEGVDVVNYFLGVDADLDTYIAKKFVSGVQKLSDTLLKANGDMESIVSMTGIKTSDKPYLDGDPIKELNALSAAIEKNRGGGLFAIELPKDNIAGKSFTAIDRNVFTDADIKAGDAITGLATNDGKLADLSDPGMTADLANDYKTTIDGNPTTGNGITIFTPDHKDAFVTRVFEVASGNVDKDTGIRHAYSKNVKIGDIITGNAGDNGATHVVLVNHLANNQEVSFENIEDKDLRCLVVQGAIKESAAGASNDDWSRTPNIDLTVVSDTLKGVTRFDQKTNVRTITLGVKAGQIYKDSRDDELHYSATDEGAGQLWFNNDVKADQIVAQAGVSAVRLFGDVDEFQVREVLAQGKGTSLQLAVGSDYSFDPTSDKVHTLAAQDGATLAEKSEGIELGIYSDGDKARIYTYGLEGDGSTLALNSMQIDLKEEIKAKVLNGVTIENSTPDKLPGVIEVKPGNENATCTLDLGEYIKSKDQTRSAATWIHLASNKGVNGIRVDGPGTLNVIGDTNPGNEVILQVDGTEKGNGLGYAVHSADATLKLVKGILPVKGNTLVKVLDIENGTEYRSTEGSLELIDLKVAKGGKLTSLKGDVSIANLADGAGAIALSEGKVAIKGDLKIDNNDKWSFKNVDAAFEGGIAATKSEAAFENADGKKVDFKGDLNLSKESNWQFKGGDVAIAGKTALDNAQITFDGCKTTIAGDCDVQNKGKVFFTGGDLTVQGDFYLSESTATSTGNVSVKDFIIEDNALYTKMGGDLVIGGNACIAGRLDASQDTQGKIKFTGDNYTVAFDVTPISEDGKQIQTLMVSVASKDSIEGLDKAKEFILSDLDYIEEFGTNQLLEVYKKNPKIVLFDNVPDDQSDGILAKVNVDQYSIIPGLLAEKGSSVVNAQNASDPDDLRILSKMLGDAGLKDIPAGLMASLAKPYRLGRRNAGGLLQLVPNADNTGVTAQGAEITGEQLLTSVLGKYTEQDKEHAGKRLGAITRSTAEENARAAIQIANSARATAYNNLDKLMDPANHYSIWASGFGDIARQKVSGYKVNYDIYGFEAGLDAALNNYWTLGILGGYGKAAGKFKGEYRVAKIDSYLDKCDTKSYFGGVYGMWSDYVQDLEVKFSLLAGHLKFDEKRNIKSPFSGKSVTDFGTKGWWISGNVDATYKHWDVVGIKLGPWAAFSFTDVHQKEGANPIFGKDEIKINDGKGLVSRVSEKYNRYAPELTIGVAADYDSPFGLINLAAGYKRDFHKLSGGKSYLHSQVIGADGKVLDGAHKADLGKETHQAGKNSFVAQASYNMEYGPVGLSLGVRGQIGDHFKDVAGSATISYSF